MYYPKFFLYTCAFPKGWNPDNGTCFDPGEVIDTGYRFKSSSDLNTLPYVGVFSIYGGGGYVLDIGPKQSLVTLYLTQLKAINWIDVYTRALFIDSCLYNANTRLLTRLKVVFEISEYGSIVMATDPYSFNVLPYVSTWDYVVLACQLLFIVVLILRIFEFIKNIIKFRLGAFKMFVTWLRWTEICLSMSSVVCFILRIDRTLQGVTDAANYLGIYTSYSNISECNIKII